MAKISRKKLARGTKLMPGHVSDPLADAATQMTNIDINRDQMKAPMAPFCVNLSVPFLGPASLPAGTITIPFALPPLQEDFESRGTFGTGAPVYPAAMPQIMLKSVSFSFDQRGEPAAIASQFWTQSGTGNTGKYGYSSEQAKLTYEDVTKLDIKISLHEKDQAYFGDAYPYKLQKELWSTVIPESVLSGRALRANPFIQTDIDIAIDPYKTLLFTVHCPGLTDTAGRNLTLPSIEVSMKFLGELVQRDSGSGDVQNIPADGGSGENKYGAKTAPSITISEPGTGTALKAADTAGVNTNVTTIDSQFTAKLQGGYDRFGDTPPTEVIKDDAAYDVIAVPLYQNSANGGISANATFLATWPYVGTRDALEANAGLFDRRIIPIHHSYTIHHAILAWNWSPYRILNADWNPDGTPPMDGAGAPIANAQGALWIAPSEDIALKVGIGIGTGMRADGFGYAEVGELAINNPNNYAPGAIPPTPGDPDTTGDWDTSLIDRITSTDSPPASMLWNAAGDNYAFAPKWNWELHSIPLTPTTDSANGYYVQGDPVFVGPGWTTTKERSDLDGAAPATAGAEQWIEVRSLLYPSEAGKGFDTAVADVVANLEDPNDTLGKLPSILVGYGGCYVYLICKKHLTK